MAQTAPAQTPPPAVQDGLTAGRHLHRGGSDASVRATSSAPPASGDRVYARFQGHTLRGRAVTYDLAQGIGTADGEVELVDPDGNTVFASHLELDSDLKAGVAVDFATRYGQRRQPDGRDGRASVSENVNELNYALFTPCPICDAEGNPKTPSISIQAEKVVQDEELRAVLYRNAVFSVGGVPVLLTAVLRPPRPDRGAGLGLPGADPQLRRRARRLGRDPLSAGGLAVRGLADQPAVQHPGRALPEPAVAASLRRRDHRRARRLYLRAAISATSTSNGDGDAETQRQLRRPHQPQLFPRLRPLRSRPVPGAGASRPSGPPTRPCSTATTSAIPIRTTASTTATSAG